MSSASSLYERYSIGKTYFYKRRDYLIKLGYDLEPVKDGIKKIYTDEQVQILDELDAHIKDTGAMEEFTKASAALSNSSTQAISNELETNNNNGLVHSHTEQIEINEQPTEQIYVDTNPLADIQEQQLASVDVAAQYSAAQNLTAFNYLTVDYMKHRDFSVQELAESVHKSEQAVRKTFDSMMENPSSATKKIRARVRRQRTQRARV
jgi:SOS-response transcriptional repressor LexA